MTKRIISIVLCICLLFCASVNASAKSDYPRTVPGVIRVVDGIGELLKSFVNLFSLKSRYPNSHPVCDIPELDNDYVPQGFCYIDSMNLFAVTYYSAGDENSILALINPETGERVKTVKLQYADFTPCLAHVGGVADIGDSLLISSGKTVRRLKLEAVENAEDYGYVQFCGTLNADMQASYLCSYGNYLFVGQFYQFTLGGKYDTPKEQRIFAPKAKRHYAMCEQFDLSDMDKVFEDGEAVPCMVISMPNSVQGIAYDGETFVTSSSGTVSNASRLRYYNLTQSDKKFNMNGNDVPLYYVIEKNAVQMIKIPPMSEGIDFYNGKVAGIFESGANKFSYVRIRTPYICIFE